MLAMGHFLNPNILTVCNGAKKVTNSQDRSVVSTAAAAPIRSLTPSPGFEPGTKRLTVARSTAELRRIVF
tara:strand:- start:624 stop:833 length:210 start_codon:yes stop_codon:yes gene_type:complete